MAMCPRRLFVEIKTMMQDETPLASFSIPKASKPTARPATLRQRRNDTRHRSNNLNGPARLRHGDQAHFDEEVFHIHLADSVDQQQAASLLIRKMYRWRGYAIEDDAPVPASRITLFAECRGAVVGTMGLFLDGDRGLPADENFREQVDVLRDQGRRLCEPSRLAIDAGMTKRVFASMIHVSYLYAHVINGFSDYIIEVNPRHVVFYQRMLGFERVGPVRPCSRVGAPAVLLRVPLSHMGEQIRACGGRPELQTDERSFYPFFFAPGEEVTITNRLLANCR